MRSQSEFLLALLHGAGVAALAGLSAATAGAAPPLDPPQRFHALGRARATIAGPGCCGETQFAGRFRLAYDVTSSGETRLGHLSFDLDDRDVFVQGGFLDLFTERIAIRCGGGLLTSPARGTSAGPANLKWPAGTVQIEGGFTEERLPSGTCQGRGTSFTAVNSVDVSLVHRPADDQVSLNGSFTTELEGRTFVLSLQGSGRFENRPPEARLVFRYPDGTKPQAGCPAFWRQNEQKKWEWAAEANSTEGLVASLVSQSVDPDGEGGAADIFGESWFDTLTGGVASVLAEGRDVGPFTFGWGAPHQVELLTSDHLGATDAAACSFRVIDTRPPVVQPPAPLVTGCSTVGGATSATSPALAAFLSAASAVDVADATPLAYPPLLTSTGAGVTSSTLFPADGAARSVTFRVGDDSGNLGTATSTVRVVDSAAPSLRLAVNRPMLSPDHKFWWIVVTPTMTDACGGAVRLNLVSIKSNAPSYDTSDILDATYRTDDRGFYLFSRPAGPGLARIYTITYQATDLAGNSRLATTTVTVGL